MEGRLYGILRGAMLQGHLSNTWHFILYERGRNRRPPVWHPPGRHAPGPPIQHMAYYII